MRTPFRDPGIPDGEKSLYRAGPAGQADAIELTHLVAREHGAYRTFTDARMHAGQPGTPQLTMAIDQYFGRSGGYLTAERYRAETRSGNRVVSREEANFAGTAHLQPGLGPAPFPVAVMPIAAGLTLLRGLDFAEGPAVGVDAWLAFSVHWPLSVRVEQRVAVEAPSGVHDCWQVRIRPSFNQVNSLLDKVIGGLLPPFLAHFETTAPHRLVRMTFPTELSLSAPRAAIELVS